MNRTNTELNRKIRHEIELITKEMDDQFDLTMYADIMFDDFAQIELNFRHNYGSSSLGILPNDELTGDALADLLIKSIGQDEFVCLVKYHSYYEISDYYVKWNEIDSLCVGEFEYEIVVSERPALAELIAQATDKDWPVQDRESFLAYGWPCDRVIARLDAETFLQDNRVQTVIARSQLKAVK